MRGGGEGGTEGMEKKLRGILLLAEGTAKQAYRRRERQGEGWGWGFC